VDEATGLVYLIDMNCADGSFKRTDIQLAEEGMNLWSH
jgi:hypothetical protein